MDRRADLGGEERRSRDGEVTSAPVIGKSLRMRVSAIIAAGDLAGGVFVAAGCAESARTRSCVAGHSCGGSGAVRARPGHEDLAQSVPDRAPDGVALLDAADNAEIILKPDELLPALAALPASNWPYGRVVAAAENGGARRSRIGWRSAATRALWAGCCRARMLPSSGCLRREALGAAPSD